MCEVEHDQAVAEVDHAFGLDLSARFPLWICVAPGGRVGSGSVRAVLASGCGVEDS